jgi:hypothetical protein
VNARILALRLAAGVLLASCFVNAAEDPATTATARANRKEEVRLAYGHVSQIHGPVRMVDALKLGGQHVSAAAAKLVVTGGVTDKSLGEILAQVRGLIGKQINRKTKVTGDEKFAVVELGDREKDPCCFLTVTLANHAGTWGILENVLMSH